MEIDDEDIDIDADDASFENKPFALPPVLTPPPLDHNIGIWIERDLR